MRGKEGGRERERERERSPLISIINPTLRYSSAIYYRQNPTHLFLANVTEVPPIPRIGTTSLYGKRFFSHNVLICLSKLLGKRR